jgi:hypothetical protein
MGLVHLELLHNKVWMQSEEETDTLARIAEVCGVPDETTWPGIGKRQLAKWPEPEFRVSTKTWPAVVQSALVLDPASRITARRYYLDLQSPQSPRRRGPPDHFARWHGEREVPRRFHRFSAFYTRVVNTYSITANTKWEGLRLLESWSGPVDFIVAAACFWMASKLVDDAHIDMRDFVKFTMEHFAEESEGCSLKSFLAREQMPLTEGSEECVIRMFFAHEQILMRQVFNTKAWAGRKRKRSIDTVENAATALTALSAAYATKICIEAR